MSAKSPKTTTTLSVQPPENFEAAMAELETLADRLEAGDAPLAHMVADYERSAQLIAFCKGQLQTLEARVTVVDGAGSPSLSVPTVASGSLA